MRDVLEMMVMFLLGDGGFLGLLNVVCENATLSESPVLLHGDLH